MSPPKIVSFLTINKPWQFLTVHLTPHGFLNPFFNTLRNNKISKCKILYSPRNVVLWEGWTGCLWKGFLNHNGQNDCPIKEYCLYIRIWQMNPGSVYDTIWIPLQTADIFPMKYTISIYFNSRHSHQIWYKHNSNCGLSVLYIWLATPAQP